MEFWEGDYVLLDSKIFEKISNWMASTKGACAVNNKFQKDIDFLAIEVCNCATTTRTHICYY